MITPDDIKAIQAGILDNNIITQYNDLEQLLRVNAANMRTFQAWYKFHESDYGAIQKIGELIESGFSVKFYPDEFKLEDRHAVEITL